ncbi:MAG: MFS transporter [Pseudomonadota bacterium]
MWIGQTLSLIGSSVARFAIIWWITERTGSATTLATLALFALVPAVLLGPIAGALVDRWNRKLTIIIADAITASAIALLALLFWLDSIVVWHIYVVSFVSALGGTFHGVAIMASTSLMVPEKHLARIQGMNQAIQGLLAVAGAPLGALALAFLPLYAILGLDVFTALFAIVPLLFIRIPQPEKPKQDHQASDKPASVMTEVYSGVMYIWQWTGLFLIILSAMVINALVNPILTLVPILITGHFLGSATELAWFQSAFGFGVLFGGILLGVWGGFKKKTLMLPISLTGMGLCSITIGFTPPSMLWLACAGILFFGVLNSMLNGSLIAILQRNIEPAMQGRVFTVMGSGSQGAVPIGLLVAGPAVDAIGATIWFVIAGVVILGFGALMPFSSHIMKLEESQQPLKTAQHDS